MPSAKKIFRVGIIAVRFLCGFPEGRRRNHYFSRVLDRVDVSCQMGILGPVWWKVVSNGEIVNEDALNWHFSPRGG